MKRVIVITTGLLLCLSMAQAEVYVKGKGGIITEGNKKTICPKPSPYICAIVKNMDESSEAPLVPGTSIRVITAEGEEHTGVIISVQGKGEQAGEITFH